MNRLLEKPGSRLGVASLDLTPPPGRLWGRLRGLAMVVAGPSRMLAILALDCAVVPCGRVAEVERALGWPAGTVVIWTGGVPRVDPSVPSLVRLIQRAVSAAVAGTLRVGVGPAWGLRSAVEDPTFLAGQRLERSHRQLRSRAVDPKLAALVERVHHSPPPPGVSWGHLLVDQRVAMMEAVDADGVTLGIIGWLPGTDPFGRGNWPSAGIRGAVARRLAAEGAREGHPVPPVVVVGPEASGLLGGARRPARDPSEARGQCEEGAEALVKTFRRLRVEGQAVAATEVHTHTTTASPPSGEPVDLGWTRLGPIAMVHTPWHLSMGMALRLRTVLAVEPLLWVCTGRAAPEAVRTPREAHHIGDADDTIGPWLVNRLGDIPGAPEFVADRQPVLPSPAVDPDTPSVTPAPHVVATLRRGYAPRGGGRTLELVARFRPDGLAPAGDRWQVRLEWERDGTWSVARVRGLPVDDLHQGMRMVVEETRAGPLAHVRWSVPELRRWSGRRFRLRIGPAYGEPCVSATFRLK